MRMTRGAHHLAMRINVMNSRAARPQRSQISDGVALSFSQRNEQQRDCCEQENNLKIKFAHHSSLSESEIHSRRYAGVRAGTLRLRGVSRLRNGHRISSNWNPATAPNAGGIGGSSQIRENSASLDVDSRAHISSARGAHSFHRNNARSG